MKFCSKCGKELMDEAVICPGCGCAINGANRMPAQNHPILKNGYGQRFGVSMGGGALFGIFMALILNRGDMGTFITLFLIAGGLFGLLFFGLLVLLLYIIEDSTVKSERKKLAMQGKIHFEGPANYKGNGGWLFVTESGLEFRAHKANFDSRAISLSYTDIISIQKSKRNLVVQINKGTYLFVVEKLDQWMSLLAQCDQTREKL